MLDIVLAVIFIGAAITGFRKGFLKSLIGLFGNIAALIASYKLSASVALQIDAQFGAVAMLAEKIRGILPMPENFSGVMASFEGMGQLYTYLESSFLPDSIKESILAAVQQQVDAVGVGVYATMADMVCNTVATSLLRGLTFIGLWLLFCLILFLISHVVAGVIHMVPVVGFIDRVGGMAVSLLLIFITTLVLYKGISILGLIEGSIFAQSQILQFCNVVLESVGWL
ncbi:MAG: CvpA family protein [Peptococcaceae bacterium]|nr:CvpA family protein [Peptococcaceae bacterium]